MGSRAKLNLARYVDNTAKHVSTLKGEEALAAAPAVVSVAKVGTAIALPGFTQAQSGQLMGISLSVRTDPGTVLDVAATVVPVEPPTE